MWHKAESEDRTQCTLVIYLARQGLAIMCFKPSIDASVSYYVYFKTNVRARVRYYAYFKTSNKSMVSY